MIIALLISLFLLLGMPLMGQMIPINLPEDGNWPTIVGDSIMLIGPKQEALTEEQRYFNPPYLIVYPGKEHLKEQMIRAALCDCDPTKPNRRIGVFSVAPDKQVSFSQGNLQYLPSLNIWKFANTQYEYLGNANKYLKPTFRNWVDLFGWSANNTTAPFGVSTSTNVADYAGTFVDWGTNTICSDAPNTWRTLSADEWEYLFEQRKNALQLRSKGSIDGHRGHILLPDNWVLPEGVQFVAQPNNLTMDLDINSYTQAEWSIMEKAGAVFLPAAGRRDGTTVGYLVEYSGVWSSTSTTNTNAFHTYYNYESQIIQHHWTSATSRINGRSVRLVHDTIVPEPPKRIGVFSVAADKQVSFSQGNLQYTQSTDTWQFAKEQYEYIGADNIQNSTLADKIDLFGWSANNTTAPFGVSMSTNNADYAGEFVDWGTNIIQGDAANTWRTLSKEEWEYLIKGRKNASNLRAAAQVNGVNGMILLPDDWECPEGIDFKAGYHTSKGSEYYAEYQQFTKEQWRELETTGAIFLPAAGMHDGNGIADIQAGGYYWSATDNGDTYAYTLISQSSGAYLTYDNRYDVRSVRLVHDTIVPETIPDPCLVVKVNDTLSINMMCVEGGTYTMGDGDKEHPVSLSSYSIGQTEVTQALWEAVMGTNPSANTASKQLPVTNVSWHDCQAFIKKLNQLTGLRFRLPTEAEWEYAARGGQRSKGYVYAGSDDIKEVAWYNGNSGNTLHAVGQKKPNELGIYDMSGNVWEWCHDWHAPYPTTHQYNPLGPEVGQIVGKRYLRVFRGGSYGYEVAYHQNAFRDITGPEPDKGTANLGLRLVLSDEVNFETIHVNDTLSFHMMDVKGGTFTMGDDNTSIASPAHQVTLSDYYIGETEVTQALWKSVMGNIPTGNKNPSYPVGYVTYADCQNFIAKLNNLTGLHFQLPTEAEWEYAAMGGNKSHNYIYSGSNTIDDVAWYDQNSENKMHNVGAKQPNELGIYDMSGNAWEWCADYYDKYTADPKNNPKGPTTGTGRVIRSGSFRTTAERCSNKHRQAREADYPDSHITFRLVLHDTVPEPPKRIGVFSVGADKQVSFSQGNLQYIQSTDTWQFAREQYEYMGEKHFRNGQLADTIEYFGWSGKNSKAPWGISLSIESSDYAGEFLDWGTNTIAGSAPNTWRTLSNDEWLYICQGRKNADQLFGLGTIGAVTGLIILPDDWQLPAGLSFTPNTDNATKNQYTYNQWAELENAGAVFIATSGYFNPKLGGMRHIGEEGHIRTNALSDNGLQVYSVIKTNKIIYSYSGTQEQNLQYAFAQRLVHDTIVPETIPEPCLVVKVNDTLSINMMCVEGGTFQMGATPEMDPDALAHEAPVHSVTLSDYYIGQIEVTQALWKTVMGTNPSTIKDNNRPVNNVSWEDCQVFIEKLNQKTGYSFRLPTEAEWEYAARGGNKSRGYKYAGSDNIDEVAWYKDNSGGKYQPFALKKPNELGIYDMSGNVFEWCQDWYGPYSADAQVNPQGPESGPYHMIRGGGWKHIQSNRVTYRRTTGANLDITSIGLRLVLHDTEPAPEPEYVDLGLSVKWATFNVGASKPEDYGNYFAWGETEPKEKYSWTNYKWCDGTKDNMTKYNATDGKTILEPEDDAAQVNWGEDWRMPSDEEFTELREKCTWTWTTQDGVKGYKITGPSGNSIFIPAAGFHYENGFNYGENGDYWSAQAGLPNNGKHLNFYPNKQINSTSYRYFGFPIRPVYDDRPTLTVIPTPEDAKVSFLCIGYQAQGHSITVDKGKNVLYQVSNVDAGYLSQGDSIYNLTKDTTLYVTLRPFSDGNWVKVDKSEYTKQEGYYVSRNNGGFASHSVWNYYVLPVLPGETYRVRGIAGQHAALWMAASTAPDPATNTRPTKISCCANRGVAAYVADEVTIPDGAKYLIINSRNGKEMMVERKVPDPCLVVKVNDTLSINLMCVEGGTFMMGAMEGDTQAKENEKPAHEVTLTYDYLIMQTEVTQGLWEAVMGEDIYDLISKSPTPTAKPISTKGDFPVGYVQLSQCLEFIDRLNALTGLHFRMPTEAEWEYAARGGNQSKGYLYAGSNTLTQVAQTSLGTVAKLLPNELGIYDMSGNIAEMTLDYLPNHETGYPSANAQVNPRQISPTGNRAIRGLRWNTTEINCRISHRNAYTTTYSGNGMGFRLVLSEEQDFRTIHVNGSYFDMSFVKGGTFMMGSDAGDAQADEQPVHEVTLSDYYIGQTEVTQHLWQKVMGDENNPSATKGNNLPVTNITWDEAQQFVERLSELTGMRFRLPTEAEWEYAARGGQKSKGYTYAGSDNIDEVGWYNGNSSNKTHVVGQKQPNELGIYDMTGNIWEYCFDWHTPYSAQAQTNPTGAATGEKHVLRGGCYHYDSKNCTNTNRHSYYTPDKGGASTGLRIVLEPQRYYRYGFTQEDWDAATSSWGHAGRGHAPADQSCIQGTMVHGIRLKVAKAGSLNVYKVPSLLEKNEDHFELVATLTTDSTGLQDFDFAEPIYIAPNEYLVFGKPSEEDPTLRPCYINISRAELPAKAKGFAHYIGTEKAKVAAPNGSLMVEFY